MFDTFTKLWDSVLCTDKIPTNPYFGMLERLNPYEVNYLNFGRQTGKTTFAKSLPDAWVFTPLYAIPNVWTSEKLCNMVNNQDYLRGLKPPKYIVLDEWTELMLRHALELYLKLQNPLNNPDREHPYIIVLGSPLSKT